MQKGRKGTYRGFEAHEAEVTFLMTDDSDKKNKNRKKKKRKGEGKGNLHDLHKNKVTKEVGDNQLNVEKGVHVIKMFLHSP